MPLRTRTTRLLLFPVIVAILFLSTETATAKKNKPKISEKSSSVDPIPRPKPAETPSPESIDRAIRQGVDLLLARQNDDGSWGSHYNTKGLNIFAPVPGAHHAFRAAVTSLCLSALIEVGGKGPEVERAINRGEAWLFRHLPQVRRADPVALYNNWAHAYSIQALAHMHDRHADNPKKQRQIRKLMKDQIDRLERYECIDGGWCYYDFNYHTQKPSGSSVSFVSAAVLVALHSAEQSGVEVPKHLIERATASIRRQQKLDFSYCYHEGSKYRPMYPINRPGGSLGRSQACNLALQLWGDTAITDQVMIDWLDRLFARNLWLDIGRKRPVPHESHFQVAAYFYYFGHYYASLAIEQVPESDRARYRDHLAVTLMRLQEKDGSWWDFPFYDYHQQYGTAFAIMSLGRCRQPTSDEP